MKLSIIILILFILTIFLSIPTYSLGITTQINPYDTVCFEKDAPIETREKIKFIQEIKVGDIVKTWNENIKKFEYKKVLKVFQRIAKQTLHIKLSNNQTMKVTPEHLIYANGVWIKAGEIKQGDKLLGSSNEEIFIESIKLIDRETRVYNFETEDNHTYIAYGVVVHNTCYSNGKGSFVYLRDGEKVPEGWVKVNDPNLESSLIKAGVLKDSNGYRVFSGENGNYFIEGISPDQNTGDIITIRVLDKLGALVIAYTVSRFSPLGTAIINGAAKGGDDFVRWLSSSLKYGDDVAGGVGNAAKLSSRKQRAINSLEKQIQKHYQKIDDFKKNPTVRPGMEDLPQEVIKQQQQARINHLEKEIHTFKSNIEKIRSGEIKY